MVELKVIKTELNKKNGNQIEYKIMTMETYKNREKGTEKAVPMTFADAKRYVDNFKFEKGYLYKVNLLYDIGWRSHNKMYTVEQGNYQLQDYLDSYEDEDATDDEIYGIHIFQTKI